MKFAILFSCKQDVFAIPLTAQRFLSATLRKKKKILSPTVDVM